MNIPYDFYLPMIFQGKEISIAVQVFTYGYYFYAPDKSVCFHNYFMSENRKREKDRQSVEHFWRILKVMKFWKKHL